MAAIVVPVVMVALILLLVVIVILKRYQNRRGKQTVLDTTQPYSVFRADSVSSSTSAIGSKAGSVELRDSDGMKLGNVYEKSVDDKV